MKKRDIEKVITNWDTRKWKTEVEGKSSLEIYKNFKTDIKEDKNYDNTLASILLYKARANVLQLNDRKRHQGESTSCPLCNFEFENLKHFILECEKLEEIRIENIYLQRPQEEKPDKIIGKFLFNENIEETKRTLTKLMKKRDQLIKNES